MTYLNRPGFVGGSISCEDRPMRRSSRYSREHLERAIHMLLEQQGEYRSQWAAMNAIASQVGCTAEALRKWARQTKTDQGKRYGLSSARLNFSL